MNARHDGVDWDNNKDDPGKEDSGHGEDLQQARLGVDDGLTVSLAIDALEEAESAGKEIWDADGELLSHSGQGLDGRDGLECPDGWEATEPWKGRRGRDSSVGPSHADCGEDDYGEDVAEAIGDDGENDAELAVEEGVHKHHAEAAVAAEEATSFAEVLEGGADAGCDGSLLDESDLALFEERLLVQAILLLFGGRGLDKEGGGGLDHGQYGDEVAVGV